MNIFVSWDVIWHQEDPRFAVLAEDPEKLRRQNQGLDAGRRIWESWILRTLGQEIGFDGASGRCEVPADQLGDLEQILEQFKQVLGNVDVAAGVGLKLSEADQALRLAMKKGGGIVFYTDEVPKRLAEMQEESSDALTKADPPAPPQGPPPPAPQKVAENSAAAGGGFAGAQQPGTPADAMSPTGEASEHSQGEAMQSMAENAPPAAEGTHSSKDFEAQFQDHAEASQDQDEQQQQQLGANQQLADLKQQVVKILQGLRDQAPLLQQLQAIEPKLFAAIQGMTQAMLLMAKQLIGGQPVQKSETHVDEVLKADLLFHQAAFRGHDGRVIGTGTFHDIEALPQDFDIADEGFIGHDGHFYSREEATRMAGADSPLQSEDLDLSEAATLEPMAKKDKQKKALKPMGQPIPVQHYSDVDGLQVADPRFQGTGSTGPEANRGSRIPRTYFYKLPGTPEAHLAASRHVYHGELPAGTKLYDMGEDPEGVLAPKWVQTKNGQEYRPADLDAAEKRIKKLGYHGYQNYGVKDAIAYFYPLKLRQAMAKGGDLEKAKLPLPENAKTNTHVELPVGAQKDSSALGTRDAGKVKVLHDDGKTGWVSVRAGQVLSNDGHPISSRNPSGR